jgi:membrane protease YdiL (CAAX protease family)
MSPIDRRRWVTAAAAVLGTIVLAVSLRITPGDPWFYPATLVLAAVWAVGAFASGPLHLGRIPTRAGRVRPVVQPIVAALLLAAVFVVGGLVVRELPYVGDRVSGVLDYAGQGSLPLVLAVTALNGIAEELFFRGALYDAVPRRPVLWTTLAYVVATLATGNLMLPFAGAILSVVVGLERRVTRGVLAPVLTHITWSLSMVLVLPLIFD